jgi:dihydroxyacetone kinase
MTVIFDNPATFADEALAGFIAANRQYVLPVDGGVVRAAALHPGQVALVIGGGSGHYPAFAGWVGTGLAGAAACGNMFASPSVGQIVRVAEAANAGGGVLLAYGNYAGDVLHFGQAQRRLNAAGIETRSIAVTDDIASGPIGERDKRRGIAGDLTVFKIAGAAADAGLSLDEVERLAIKTNERTRSLGVAFSGCTLPGSDTALFDVPQGQMSIGLGIHGEPGISEEPMRTASELADLLVRSLLADVPEQAGMRVVPILNGLGTVKYDELFLLFGKIDALLTAAGLEVVEPECGELITSLDMAGVSLTLLWLDEEIAPLWSAPADTAAYRKGTPSAAITGGADPGARPAVATPATERVAAQATEQPTAEQAVRLGHLAIALLASVQAVVIDNEKLLGDLDSVAGDGDHGIGMRRGADAAALAAQNAAGSGVLTVLTQAGDAWSERAGGTSGALWGAALHAAGQSLGNREAYSRDDLANAAHAFAGAITELGKAKQGDKTMVDALLPYVAALTHHLADGVTPAEASTRAAHSAYQAAEQTAELRPRLGRARPLAEKSLGHPDPGAISFALIALGLAATFSEGATK